MMLWTVGDNCVKDFNNTTFIFYFENKVYWKLPPGESKVLECESREEAKNIYIEFKEEFLGVIPKDETIINDPKFHMVIW